MTSSLDEETKKLKDELGEEKDPVFAGTFKGSLCFLDQSRVCSADCVAWNTDYKEKFASSPDACVLLVSMGQQGAGLLSLVRLLSGKKGPAPEVLHPPPPKVTPR